MIYRKWIFSISHSLYLHVSFVCPLCLTLRLTSDQYFINVNYSLFRAKYTFDIFNAWSALQSIKILLINISIKILNCCGYFWVILGHFLCNFIFHVQFTNIGSTSFLLKKIVDVVLGIRTRLRQIQWATAGPIFGQL